MFRNRQVRWAGLLLYAGPISLMNIISSAGFLEVAMIWALPLLLVMTLWASDLLKGGLRSAASG